VAPFGAACKMEGLERRRSWKRLDCNILNPFNRLWFCFTTFNSFLYPTKCPSCFLFSTIRQVIWLSPGTIVQTCLGKNHLLEQSTFVLTIVLNFKNENIIFQQPCLPFYSHCSCSLLLRYRDLHSLLKGRPFSLEECHSGSGWSTGQRCDTVQWMWFVFCFMLFWSSFISVSASPLPWMRSTC